MKETYIDIAIKHYEKRIKNLNCRIWEEQLLDKLKQIQQQEREVK